MLRRRASARSVEKLHYLPEAHTDFLLAVIGEELGLRRRRLRDRRCSSGSSRAPSHIGRQAIALDRIFAGLFAQGIGIWIGGQAFINMGVNLGVLPTKGLTLPLMSYGGIGDRDELVALAILLRVDYREPACSCAEGAHERARPPMLVMAARHRAGTSFPGLAVADGDAARAAGA